MHPKPLLITALALLTPHAASAACASPNGCFELSAIEVFEPSSRPGHIIRRFGFEVLETGFSADNGTTRCEAQWSRLVSAGYPQSYTPCEDDTWSWYISRWENYKDLDVELRHVYEEVENGETVVRTKLARATVLGDNFRCDYTVVGETTCWGNQGMEVPVYEASTA